MSGKEFSEKRNQEIRIKDAERARKNEELVEQIILKRSKLERNVEITEEAKSENKMEMVEDALFPNLFQLSKALTSEAAKADKARLDFVNHCFDQMDAQADKIQADYISGKSRKVSRSQRKKTRPNMDEIVKKIKKIDKVGQQPDWLQKQDNLYLESIEELSEIEEIPEPSQATQT